MKKNNLILMIVTISIFVVLLVGATYAYFASNTNTGNGLDFSATLDDNNIAFTATSGTLSLHVAAENMLESQTGSGDVIAAESTGTENITVSLSSNTETPIACTYNVYFQWNNGQAYLTPTNANKNEFTLELELQDSDGTGSEGTNKFASETQLTRVITTTNKTLIVEGASIVGSSLDSGSQTWVPTAKFYNLTDNQSALAGSTFGGKFTIEDVECNVKEDNTLSGKVLAKVSDSEYISSQDQSAYVVRHEEVIHEGTTYDAGVRYEGYDPDNYVQFNGNEEWRIIGVFEGSTIGLEPGKQYTKIIKSTSIGDYAWDDVSYYFDEETQTYIIKDDVENDWENSSLNAYLNGEYLSGLSESNKIAKYNGDYSTWYLRGIENTNANTLEWYIGERITGTPGYKDGVAGNANATTTGAIGLMYPSDFGYAAYGEGCKYDGIEYGYNAQCSEVDWLIQFVVEFQQWEWLISPDPRESNSVYFANGYYANVFGNCIIGDDEEEYEFVIRPTLYLEADLTATGTGTKLDPYVLN